MSIDVSNFRLPLVFGLIFAGFFCYYTKKDIQTSFKLQTEFIKFKNLLDLFGISGVIPLFVLVSYMIVAFVPQLSRIDLRNMKISEVLIILGMLVLSAFLGWISSGIAKWHFEKHYPLLNEIDKEEVLKYLAYFATTQKIFCFPLKKRTIQAARCDRCKKLWFAVDIGASIVLRTRQLYIQCKGSNSPNNRQTINKMLENGNYAAVYKYIDCCTKNEDTGVSLSWNDSSDCCDGATCTGFIERGAYDKLFKDGKWSKIDLMQRVIKTSK